MGNTDGLCSILNRRADAAAFISGSEKYPNIHGRVLFYGVGRAVLVRAEVMGLPKEDGRCGGRFLGFHIHSGEKCSGNADDAFADTDGHYNPNDRTHPHHAGDMPSLLDANGEALSLFITDRFTLREVIGKAVIIHLMEDDLTSQPAGNSGEKIACGIIRKTMR